MSVAANIRFAALPQEQKEDASEYNFKHFRSKHFLLDGLATLRSKGIQPGQLAPDFTVRQVDGGSVTLSQLRGKPVLLHFGSFT